MGKIFCIMGKSASGKDAIYKKLLEDDTLGLVNIVSYTTRPIRKKETDGIEYHFVDAKEEERLNAAGKVIERRVYDTRLGKWSYFTVDDGTVDLNKNNYIIIGTLDSYKNLSSYYGSDKVIPIYIEVEDSVRLERALNREKKQHEPKYAEMCRRFLADTEDFAPQRLKEARVIDENIFTNHEDISDTVSAITDFIRGS